VSAPYRHCRHCGDFVPHDAPSAICGRCACRPVADRGQPREPGSDDDVRQPTRCLTCGLIGSGEVCPRCMELLSDIDKPEPEPIPPTPALGADATASLRARLLEAGQRREYIWLAGHAELLNRCAKFGLMARAQPR
jgi:hypothetical protein